MAKKRWHIPHAKPGQLKVAYGRPDPGEPPEAVFCFGGDGANRRDNNMLMYFFSLVTLPETGRTLMKEMEARSYDITTLKFSIQKNAEVVHG